MRHCSVCILPEKSCRCKTTCLSNSDANMWPILDGSLKTRCQLRILHLLAYDRNLIRLLPIPLEDQVSLSSMLTKLAPVLTHDLLPNLFPVLQKQEDIWKLRPYLHILPDGRPDLGQSFRQLTLAGSENVSLQPDAVLSLACEFYALDIIDHFWMMSNVEQRHSVIVKDPFVHCTVYETGLLHSTLNEEEVRDLIEQTLILIFKEPSCSSRGTELFFHSLQKKRSNWLTRVLFGFPRCYLDAVKMQSAVYLPLARALISSFPIEEFLGWAQKSWSRFVQHLAIWLELWPLLSPQQKGELLIKWIQTEDEQNLIASEQFALTVRERKHLLLIADFLRATQPHHHGDNAMSILSFALLHTNFPLLSEFFSWAPVTTLEEVWEELLTDFVFWSNSTEFSAYCTLLENSPTAYAQPLAQMIITRVKNLGDKMVEPRSDELELLLKFSKSDEEAEAFIQCCFESCLSNLWSWEIFAWLWWHISSEERNALIATALTTKMRLNTARSYLHWLPEYGEIILNEWENNSEDDSIELSRDLLWRLLEHGQPVLFNVLWEHLLSPQDREDFRETFAQMQPQTEWLKYIGLGTGKPKCLETVLQRFLLGQNELQAKFWDVVFECDNLSDYAVSSGVIPVEDLANALPSGLKEIFAYDCLSRYCGLYQLYADTLFMYFRHCRASLASCILLESTRTLAPLPESVNPPNSHCLIQSLLNTAEDTLSLLTNKDRVRKFLESHGSELLMTAVLHQRIRCLLNKVDPIFEAKLVSSHDWWNSLLRIDIPGRICAHSLCETTPLADNGRRPDPKWLEKIFSYFLSSDHQKVMPVSIPGLSDFSNLDARVDALANEFDTLLDLMIPVGETGMTGTPYEKIKKKDLPVSSEISKPVLELITEGDHSKMVPHQKPLEIANGKTPNGQMME